MSKLMNFHAFMSSAITTTWPYYKPRDTLSFVYECTPGLWKKSLTNFDKHLWIFAQYTVLGTGDDLAEQSKRKLLVLWGCYSTSYTTIALCSEQFHNFMTVPICSLRNLERGSAFVVLRTYICTMLE